MENPYIERQQLGYDLSDLSDLVATELADLSDDETVSDFELEFALRKIRLKYVNLVILVYLVVGIAVSSFTGIHLWRNLASIMVTVTVAMWINYGITFAVFGFVTISGIGLFLRTRW